MTVKASFNLMIRSSITERDLFIKANNVLKTKPMNNGC